MELNLPKGIRATKFGTFEATVNHQRLPKGRLCRNFTSLDDAVAFRKTTIDKLKLGRTVVIPTKLQSDGVPVAVMLNMYLSSDTAKIAASDRPTVLMLASRIKVTTGAIDLRWAEAWVREMKQKDQISPGTIRKRVESLARALDWWHRQNRPDELFANPLKMLAKGYSGYGPNDLLPGMEVRVDVHRDRRLHAGEQEKIEAAIIKMGADDAKDLLMLFRLIVSTGLRLREAYMLTLPDVMLEQRTIHVRRSKTGKPRDVPTTRQLEGWLKEYIGSREGKGYLFPWMIGDSDEMKLLVTGRLTNRFRSVFDSIGAEDLVEHDLRHEATCRWLEKKNAAGHWLFRPEEVRRITGHKSVQVFERYLSLRGSDLAVGLD